MLDFAAKRIYLFDLDDTLINTNKATDLGLERAHQKLVSECVADFEKLPSLKQFKDELHLIYKNAKDDDGKKFYDYDARVFEVYCDGLSKKGLKLIHYEFSLAARLYYNFRQTRNASLMANPGAFELLQELGRLNTTLCVTEGKCNYQHTKAMLTDIEQVVESVIVLNDKKQELKQVIESRGFSKPETVLIGDREADLKAGKTAEIDTVCVKTGNQDYSAFEGNANFVVSDLWELLSIIRPKR